MSLTLEQSNTCKGRAHCGTCRNREGGRAWRESLGVAFILPAGAPDFPCPYGVPWGAVTCARCLGPHATSDCPIPDDYIPGNEGPCCDPPKPT
jgi:hypothetical protein